MIKDDRSLLEHWLSISDVSETLCVWHTTRIMSILSSVLKCLFSFLYSVEDISQFLIDSYSNTDTSVLIYENEAPHYVIATSTGSEPARLVLTADPTQDCPDSFDFSDDTCTSVRISLQELLQHDNDRNDDDDDDDDDIDSMEQEQYHSMDVILARAAQIHMAQSYPAQLLSIKRSEEDINSDIYVSQSSLYDEQPGIQWQVMVVAPGAVSDNDAITLANSTMLVGVLCVIGGLGFVICASFLAFLYLRRTERCVICADWRFTCVFIGGCALLNISTFTLLGENTDAACLYRMWTFNVFFVMALAPLFVKIWRVKELVGHPRMRRTSISNQTTALYTLPMILVQCIILLIFTFVDPPVSSAFIENIEGVITQRIVCSTETDAFWITQLLFDGFFVFGGCILAYMTRNINDEFGEAKQLIFAMYNIALVGVIIVLVTQIADLSTNASSILRAIGVFWGTVFSTAAFVVPRILQLQQQSLQGHGRKGSSIRISGLNSAFCNSSSLNGSALGSALFNNGSSALSTGDLNDSHEHLRDGTSFRLPKSEATTHVHDNINMNRSSISQEDDAAPHSFDSREDKTAPPSASATEEFAGIPTGLQYETPQQETDASVEEDGRQEGTAP
jgi:hypothetical protein